jgi:hypothetical protein
VEELTAGRRRGQGGDPRNIGDIIPRTDNSFTRLDLLGVHSYYLETKHLPVNNMPPKNTLGDAWDDDWESLADVHVPLVLESNRSHLVERRRKAR